jgi:dipeptidyl aminopeptidase/acylaminoacyl peptidase
MDKRKQYALHFVPLILSSLIPSALAQPALHQILDELSAVRHFQGISISPDGGHLAWVEDRSGSSGSSAGNSAIYVTDLKPSASASRRLSAGRGSSACAEHSITWSPDGKRIAFLSDREKKGQLELYVAPAAGGVCRKLTNLRGLLAQPRWSPNGRQLAFLFTESAPPSQPHEFGFVVEGHIDHQRLAVVDAESGKITVITPPDLFAYEYDWMPDGRSFAVTAAPGPGSDNWYIAQLYTVAIESGRMQHVLKPKTRIAVPRWSPDGKSIAFIGGLMSQGFPGGDVYLVPIGGGEPRNVTEGEKSSVGWLTWLNAKELLLTEHLDGGSGISTLDATSGKLERRWRGEEWIHAGGALGNFSVARDGETSAAIRHSWEHPPEAWAGQIGRWRQITDVNKDRAPAWGKPESIHWPSGEFVIQGWLLYPRNYSSNRRYPLVVSVHGGPAFITKPSWPGMYYDVSVLSSQGYFVLFPNPRGSYGQGGAFNRANFRDFGGGDFRDILAGVDAMLKKYPIDKDRIGITGWSYGGYMTMWAVTQTNRFHAAVAGAGISNWRSYYGQNSIDQWMIPFFGASVYDDPGVYAKRSPINFVKQVKTPTLIVVGKEDTDCPAPQSREFWHALKTLGVETQLVIYPGEGHAFRNVEHRHDVIRRTLEWFDRYLK